MKRIFAHIGFSCALTLTVLNLIGAGYIYIITAGLAALFAVSLAVKRLRQAAAVPVCLGSAVFACLVYLCVYQSAVIPALQLDGKEAQILFYTTDYPVKTASGYRYTAIAERIMLNGAPQRIKLVLNSSVPLDAQPYQYVTATAKFKSLCEWAFGSFGYWGKGIYTSAKIFECSAIEELSASPMRYITELKGSLVLTLAENVKGDAGGLAIALITGNKAYISDSLYLDVLYSGTAHIMAVSGFHLTLITGFVYFVLKAFKVNGRAISVITILTVVIYSALVGFTYSVVRSGIMLSIVCSGELFKRRADSLNSLGAAVFLICLNPFAICDLSFSLSAVCVLALLTLLPYLRKTTDKIKRFSKRERNAVISLLYKGVAYPSLSFLTSFCCIFCSLPILYIFIGYTTVAGLLSNILIMPLASVSTLLSLVAFIASPFRLISKLFFTADYFYNSLLIKVIRFFGSFSGSTVTLNNYFGFIAAGVLIIFAICFILNNKKLIKTAFCISLAAVFAFGAYSVYNEKSNAHIYITKGGAVVATCDGNTAVCGVNGAKDYNSVRRYLIAKGEDIDLIITKNNNGYSQSLARTFTCDKTVISGDGLSYEAKFGESYFVKTVDGSTEIKVNGAEFNGDSADITLDGDAITDGFGTIDLTDGDIIYDISKNGNYTARRLG